jgi:large subunit ribosomal protein L29
MKLKQLKELRDKSIDELKQILKVNQAELVKIKTELTTKKLKNTSLVREKNKDIAQIKTLIREKELKIR